MFEGLQESFNIFLREEHGKGQQSSPGGPGQGVTITPCSPARSWAAHGNSLLELVDQGGLGIDLPLCHIPQQRVLRGLLPIRDLVQQLGLLLSQPLAKLHEIHCPCLVDGHRGSFNHTVSASR